MKMNLGIELFGAFLVVLILTRIMGFIGFNSVRNLKTDMGELYKNCTFDLTNIEPAYFNFMQILLAIRQAILEEDSARITIVKKNNTSANSLAELAQDLLEVVKKFRFEKLLTQVKS
jgi:hypothetical protein